jgi:hypothetical protein
MYASHDLPATVRDAACRIGTPPAATMARHENLVIENLTELASAGAPASSFCWADFAVAGA